MSPVTIEGLSSSRPLPGQEAEGRPEPAGVAPPAGAPDTQALDAAILRTVVYADVFDYPLTTVEVHRYLIGHPASISAVERRLARADRLRERLDTASSFWFLAGREDLTTAVHRQYMAGLAKQGL